MLEHTNLKQNCYPGDPRSPDDAGSPGGDSTAGNGLETGGTGGTQDANKNLPRTGGQLPALCLISGLLILGGLGLISSLRRHRRA